MHISGRIKAYIAPLMTAIALLCNLLMPAITLAAANCPGGAYKNDGSCICPPGMSDMDCQAIAGPWPNWDPNSGNFNSCATSSASLVGSDNAQKIYNYFIAKGMKPFMAAGFLGNIYEESATTFDPTIVQGGGHAPDITVDGVTGYGIIQWTSSNRQQGLADLAKKEGVKAGDLGVQLDYIWQELNNDYKGSTLDPLMASTNVTDATHIIELNYEAHAAPPIHPIRTEKAIGYLNLYGSSTPHQTGTASTPPTGDTATIDGSCGGAVGGAVGIDSDGNAFPLRTTQTAIKTHQPTWCWQSQTNCHHNYPAADIFTDVGTEVLAARGGRVVVAEEVAQCTGQIGGNTNITIQGDDGKFYFYAHMQGALEVKKGATVKTGQGLGHVGPSPCAQNTDPHLHIQWYTSMITGDSTSMEIQPMLTKAFASLPQ